MFLRLKQKSPTDKPAPSRWVIVIIITTLLCAFLLRFIDWTIMPPRSLITSAPGLVHLSTFEDTISYSNLDISLPTQTFGASIFATGVYTQPNDIFPTDTVSLVYIRDSWRAFEIDYSPERTLEEQRAILSLYPQEELMLDETTPAIIVTRDNTPRCVDYEDDLPNKCEITLQLLFARNDLLISISADGAHATQGELIEIARSFASEDTTQ